MVSIKELTWSSHARIDRQERMLAILMTVGFGEICYYKKEEHSTRAQCFTDTGCLLIIEDDIGLNLGLSKALKADDRQIISCHDLKAAREQLLCGSVSLILLDLELSSQMQHHAKENLIGRFPTEAFAWTSIQFGGEGREIAIIKGF